MSYFVTGATGFIGRHLVTNLLKRKGTIHVLIRAGSEKKFERIAETMGWDRKRFVVIAGDLAKPKLGVPAAKVRALSGKIAHFFHLAAIYDISADAESQRVANIDGTKNAIALATALNAGCFHHTSSIAAAGLYTGVFREDMFDEAEGLDDPYL
ncbi:MAG TPA: SDR family oxidoreductase, partial [Xanthomonadaceae bacterium]|nr:SDR family oxidoreductase [Xanthomonadaceae bacterium]